MGCGLGDGEEDFEGRCPGVAVEAAVARCGDCHVVLTVVVRGSI